MNKMLMSRDAHCSLLLARRSFCSYASALRRKAVKLGAPESIGSVVDDMELLDTARKKKTKRVTTANAAIRQVGSTRRVFLRSPYLNSNELEGLAYRIRVLTKNSALSSILISMDNGDETNDDDDYSLLPSSLIDRVPSEFLKEDEYVDPGFPPKPGYTYHVASGYDPSVTDPEGIDVLLSSLSDLAMAVRGDAQKTKIPTLFMPHGLVLNAGYAFLHASYVLATRETCFQITTPRMGLSLDPVGLSFALPRLGREFNQPSKDFPCGAILALMGYQASAEDCMETGIATHYVDTPTILGDLENALAQLLPWNQQQIVKNPKRLHGQAPPLIDPNRDYRNVSVAGTVYCYSDYAASGADLWVHKDVGLEDPSLETDYLPWHEDRTSDLVDYAATFADILHEPTMEGIYERFKEVAARRSTDPEEQEGILVAQDFCHRIQQASPLALTVTHRLLTLGARDGETYASCLEREHRVQAKLLQRSEFRSWQVDGRPKWKHANLKDVAPDEMVELLEE